MDDEWVDAVLDVLRRDGAVVFRTADIDDVDQWRRSMRRACRAAGLRIRTGVGNGVVWARHVDHVVTDAEVQAAGKALSSFLSGRPTRPFHELVREQQRKQLTVVSDERHQVSSTPRVGRTLPGDIDLRVIEYSSRQHAFHVDSDRFLRAWFGKIVLTDDNGEIVEEVGYVLAFTLEYEKVPNPFRALDAETADLAHIGAAIFDPATGEMRPEVDDLVEPFGDGMLIVDSIRLEPAWRGYGLGPLMVGMVIEHLGEGRRLVALQPAPTEHRDISGNVVDEVSEAERKVAIRKLGKLWANLGFQPIRDNVWVLDLSLVTFTDRMEAIRDRLGLT